MRAYRFVDLRAFLLLGGLALCLWGARLWADDPPARATETKAADKVAADKVSLVFDYGDGVEKHFTAIPWRQGMTVLAALQAAQAHPRGVRFEYRGQGATAFLIKIDDLANEADGRNWTYRVNGKLANRSFGVLELSAGDAVLWKFK